MWEQFLMYISLALVLTWTVQLARAKQRNPWLWGGAAAAIMIPMVLLEDYGVRQLIGMAPMVILLFLKSPQAKTSPSSQGITCARCSANQPHGRYYCTSCGWELKRSYPDDGQIAEETPVSAAPTDAVDQAPANANSPATEPRETVAAETAPAEEMRPPERDQAPVGVTAAEGAAQPPPPPESAPSLPRSALRPMSRGVPTAVAMTERGRGMMENGRVQEAIDQFTKALAMDAAYKPALEARAQAYESEGRNAEAEQDRRQVEAFGNA